MFILSRSVRVSSEKRLLSPSCSFVCLNVSVPIPHSLFSLQSEIVLKICREIPNLVKIGQYRAINGKTKFYILLVEKDTIYLPIRGRIFRRVRVKSPKIPISFIRYARPSVPCNRAAPAEQIYLQYSIMSFKKKLSRSSTFY
jgi:hypothetical protein